MEERCPGYMRGQAASVSLCVPPSVWRRQIERGVACLLYHPGGELRVWAILGEIMRSAAGAGEKSLPMDMDALWRGRVTRMHVVALFTLASIFFCYRCIYRMSGTDVI